MNEKSGKIKNQIAQLNCNLDRVNTVIRDLSISAGTACVPCEKTCGVAESLLICVLWDINERILTLLYRVTAINERLES